MQSKKIETSKFKLFASGTCIGHFFFLTPKNELFGVGTNSEHQMGKYPNNPNHAFLPVRVLKEFTEHHKIYKIACGFQSTIILTKRGLAFGLGSNYYRQSNGIFYKTYVRRIIIKELESINDSQKIVDISTGFYHTILRTKYNVYGMGQNSHGQLGLGVKLSKCSTPKKMLLPSNLNVAKNIIQITCGYAHTLILTKNCDVYLCGFVNEKVTGGFLPQLISKKIGYHFCSIHSGRNHIFAISKCQKIFAMGKRTDNVIPGKKNNRPGNTLFEIEELRDMNVVDIKAGDVHTLMLCGNGDVYSSGVKSYARYTKVSKSHPKIKQLFKIAENVIQIETIEYTVFLIKQNGSILMGGFNDNGCLSIGHKNSITKEGLFESKSLKSSMFDTFKLKKIPMLKQKAFTCNTYFDIIIKM